MPEETENEYRRVAHELAFKLGLKIPPEGEWLSPEELREKAVSLAEAANVEVHNYRNMIMGVTLTLEVAYRSLRKKLGKLYNDAEAAE